MCHIAGAGYKRKQDIMLRKIVSPVLIILVCFVMLGVIPAKSFVDNNSRPQLVVQLGHSDSVTSVAFSLDGRFVLTGGYDRTAHLWITATGQEIRQFRGHSKSITSVAFSPDGHFILTGSEDETARLWDAASGQEIRQFRVH